MFETAELIKILLISCPLVFLAGLIDAMAGGGGLISLPAYMAAGLPPHIATATNKCSSTFGTLVATLQFMRGKKIHYLTAAGSAIAALIGSPIGAFLNLNVDEKYLRWVLILSLPVVAAFVLLKKDFGSESHLEEQGKTKLVVGSVFIGFLIGIYDGFFGPGTGTFLILAFTFFLGFDLLTASGNAKVVNLASNIAAFVTFAAHGAILWQVGIPAAFFGIAGNFLGARLAMKNGGKMIRPMFVVVLILLSMKIIYDWIG